MCAMMKNRNGLTITTNSPAAADLYQEGLDLVLSQNYGPDAKLNSSIEADEGFAMAHVVQAYVLHLQMNVPAARAAAEKAVELSAGCSQEERQIARIVHSFTHGKGTEAIGLVNEHLIDFPDGHPGHAGRAAPVHAGLLWRRRAGLPQSPHGDDAKGGAGQRRRLGFSGSIRLCPSRN